MTDDTHSFMATNPSFPLPATHPSSSLPSALSTSEPSCLSCTDPTDLPVCSRTSSTPPPSPLCGLRLSGNLALLPRSTPSKAVLTDDQAALGSARLKLIRRKHSQAKPPPPPPLSTSPRKLVVLPALIVDFVRVMIHDFRLEFPTFGNERCNFNILTDTDEPCFFKAIHLPR